MKRSTIFLSTALAATALLYAAAYSAGDDPPRHDELGFLGNLKVGQMVIPAQRESGLFAIYVEKLDAPVLTKDLLASLSLSPRRVTRVTESYVELRGKDSQDLTRPEGFENVLVIPRHAILSIAYYSPEQPAQERE